MGPSRGTDEPAIAAQGVVDVLAHANGARFVKVWVFCVTSLEEKYRSSEVMRGVMGNKTDVGLGTCPPLATEECIYH